MASQVQRIPPTPAHPSALEIDFALENVFLKTISAMKDVDVFGKPESPRFFFMYAHQNSACGDAKSDVVKLFIAWFKELRCPVFSDKSLRGSKLFSYSSSDNMDPNVDHDILPNQLRILPSKFNRLDPMDKVVLFMSETLEQYHRTSQMDNSPMRTFAETIQSKYSDARRMGDDVDRLDSSDNYDNSKALEAFQNDMYTIIDKFYRPERIKEFHHVLTELAFLEIRHHKGAKKDGIIDVHLSGSRDHQYVPNRKTGSSVQLRLDEEENVPLLKHRHILFFKLLGAIYGSQSNYVDAFQKLYTVCVSHVESEFQEMRRLTVTNVDQYFQTELWKTMQGFLNSMAGEVRGYNHNVSRNDDYFKIRHWWRDNNAIPAEKDQNKHRAKRDESTSRWILDDEGFQRWIRPAASDGDCSSLKQVLWCQGAAGAGKSVVMASVVDYLLKESGYIEPLPNEPQRMTESDIAVCYVYCGRGDELKQTDEAILTSLAAQIFDQFYTRSGTIPAYVDDARLKCASGNRLSQQAAYNILQSLLKEFKSTFILIDALDEHRQSNLDGTTSKLLKDLAKLLKSCGPNSRLFITSRYHPDIESGASNIATITIRASDEDVRRFVASRLQEPSIANIINKSKGLADTVKNKLVENADGIFLLPALHLNHLSQLDNAQEIRELMEDLPTTIYETYHSAMEQVKSAYGHAKSSYQRATQIMGLLSCAVVPLSALQLQHALAVNDNDTQLNQDRIVPVDRLLRNITSLVSHEHSVVDFVHGTVREFFSDADEGGKYLSQCPNKLFAKICITYMSFTTFAQPCPYAMHYRELYAKYPVFHYAIKHWGKHASRCAPSDEEMQKKINDMIDPQKISLGTLEGILHGNGCLHQRNHERLIRIRLMTCRFHLAIYAGLDNIVQEMLQNKSSEVACKDWKGRMPLHIAAEMGSKRMVELLLEHLSIDDVNALSITKKDALCRAMLPPWETASNNWEEQHERMRDFLKDLESAPEQDYNSQRPIKLPLQEQIDATSKLMDVMRVLENAMREGAPDAVQNLEKSATDLVLKIYPEITISQESIEIAKLLVLNGADINSMQRGEATPLQLAVIYGCKELVEFFLKHNANPFLTHSLGYTAYELADKRESEDIKNIISSAIEALDTTEQSLESDVQKEAIPGRGQAARLNREKRSQDTHQLFQTFGIHSSENNPQHQHIIIIQPNISSPASRASTPIPIKEAGS